MAHPEIVGQTDNSASLAHPEVALQTDHLKFPVLAKAHPEVVRLADNFT